MEYRKLGWGQSTVNTTRKRVVWSRLLQDAFRPRFFVNDAPDALRYPRIPSLILPKEGGDGDVYEFDAWETWRTYVLNGDVDVASKALEIVWPSWMSDEVCFHRHSRMSIQ